MKGGRILLIVRIAGGMGNQMFQYAFARSLEIRNKKNVFLDIKGLETNKRDYELYHFNIKENYVDENKMRYFYSKNLTSKIFYYIKNKFIEKEGLVRKIRESGGGFSPSVLRIDKNAYFSGCWQSEKYFLDIEKILRKEFTFKEKPDGKNLEMINNIKKNPLSISLHVRRGDYITDVKNLKKHGICSIEYYLEALEYMKEKLGEKIHCYIFSDDMKWVKENLNLNCECTYIDYNVGDKSFEDMRLMSLCSHNIIANSTFSWWGAWLNKNPNKIVVAPKRWFSSGKIKDVDILPEKWVKIKTR